jgi:hypothetical protein
MKLICDYRYRLDETYLRLPLSLAKNCCDSRYCSVAITAIARIQLIAITAIAWMKLICDYRYRSDETYCDYRYRSDETYCDYRYRSDKTVAITAIARLRLPLSLG